MYRGSLYNTLHLWRASIEHMNENFHLKSNNIQFFFRLMQSDVRVRLCFMVNAISPAPNGISFTNWIKNFGGNIMCKAQRTNAQFEVCNKKSWGVGTDCTMATFIQVCTRACLLVLLCLVRLDAPVAHETVSRKTGLLEVQSKRAKFCEARVRAYLPDGTRFRPSAHRTTSARCRLRTQTVASPRTGTRPPRRAHGTCSR